MAVEVGLGGAKVNLPGFHLITDAQYEQMLALLAAQGDIELAKGKIADERRVALAGVQDQLRQANERADKAVRFAADQASRQVAEVISAAQELNNKSKHMRITTLHIQPLMAAVGNFTQNTSKGKA